ncbi:hypothetical protein PR048_003555 [Dryococelus australis]|uniref:Uncharacterized protein n=1 Tax=Dryococelus australis TaxID=614101 RepID=A0ABQ9IPS8_9NEOP|nr:hypothetical protein PR048_003555 [Dryococelus australis]
MRGLTKEQELISDWLKKQRRDIDLLFEFQNDGEQYSKNHNVKIRGVPQAENEDLQVNSKENRFPILDQDFDGCHRLRQPKNPKIAPAIIARFVCKENKIILLTKRKTTGPLYTNEVGVEGPAAQIYLNDHLTTFHKQLLSHSLEEKKRGNITAAWTFRGKIYIKKQDNQRPVQVKDTWSLEEVIKNNYGRE